MQQISHSKGAAAAAAAAVEAFAVDDDADVEELAADAAPVPDVDASLSEDS